MTDDFRSSDDNFESHDSDDNDDYVRDDRELEKEYETNQQAAFKDYIDDMFVIDVVLQSQVAQKLYETPYLDPTLLLAYDNHEDNYNTSNVRHFFKWYAEDNNAKLVKFFMTCAIEKEHYYILKGRKRKPNFQFRQYLTDFNNGGLDFFNDTGSEKPPFVPEDYAALLARLWNVWVGENWPSDAGFTAATRRLGVIRRCPQCHSEYIGKDVIKKGDAWLRLLGQD
jgi:hypothetical protein